MSGKGKPGKPAKTARVEQKYDPKTGRLRPAAERLPGRKDPYDPYAGFTAKSKDNPIANIAQELKGANAQIEGATLRPITPDDPSVMENARSLKPSGMIDDQIARMKEVADKKKRIDARVFNLEAQHKLLTNPDRTGLRGVLAGLDRIESRDFHTNVEPIQIAKQEAQTKRLGLEQFDKQAEKQLSKLPKARAREIRAGLATAASRDLHRINEGEQASPYTEVQKAMAPRRATTDLSQYKLAPNRFDSTRRGSVKTNSGKPNLALGELQPKNKFESSSINTLSEVPAIPPRPSAAESQAGRDRYAARSDIDAIERELNTPADLAAVVARQKEVGELEGMVQDLNTDFHRARDTIAGQGPSIANTERNVEKAAIDTQIGNKALGESVPIKKSINKKKLALAGLGGGALAAGALGLGLGIGIPASQDYDDNNNDTNIYLDRSSGGNVPPDQPYSPNPTLAYDPNTSSFSPIKRAKGGKIEKYAKGGRVRGDGCAVRGFTKGRLI